MGVQQVILTLAVVLAGFTVRHCEWDLALSHAITVSYQPSPVSDSAVSVFW